MRVEGVNTPHAHPSFRAVISPSLGAFVRYDDTERRADTVVDLAAARAPLEDIRLEIANERTSIMGLGRSRARDDGWRDIAAAARSELFTIAHASN